MQKGVQGMQGVPNKVASECILEVTKEASFSIPIYG